MHNARLREGRGLSRLYRDWMHSRSWNPGPLAPGCVGASAPVSFPVFVLALRMFRPTQGAPLRVGPCGTVVLTESGHRWGHMLETRSGVGREERKGQEGGERHSGC